MYLPTSGIFPDRLEPSIFMGAGDVLTILSSVVIICALVQEGLTPTCLTQVSLIPSGTTQPAPKPEEEDLFTYGYYNYRPIPFTGADLHQLYPSSIVVGTTNEGSAITVDGNVADRDDEWLYVDSVGTEVFPKSLFHAQRSCSDPSLSFLRWKTRNNISANHPDDEVSGPFLCSVSHAYASGAQEIGIEESDLSIEGASAVVRFPLRNDPTIQFEIEESTDLATWTPAADQGVLESLSPDFFQIRSSAQVLGPRKFYRVRYFRTSNP